MLETDASIKGLGAVLSQRQDDNRLHPIAYASRALNNAEKNYGITELETLAVVWSITHFHPYLYGHSVTILTEYSAVKSVLGAPTLSRKHARWWTRVYGRGIKEIELQFRSGRENVVADSLSRCPTGQPPAKGEAEDEFQVAQIDSKSISSLLEEVPSHAIKKDSLLEEQQKDPWVKQMVNHLENGLLPTDDRQVKKLVNQAAHFALVEDILYFIDSKKGNRKRAVVPLSLRKQIMEEVSPARVLKTHWFTTGGGSRCTQG